MTITDDDGAATTRTQGIRIDNVAPAVDIVDAEASIDENGVVTLKVDFTDPGTLDTHDAAIDWGDGSAPEGFRLILGSRSFSRSHRYLDDDPSGTASDDNEIVVTLLETTSVATRRA